MSIEQILPAPGKSPERKPIEIDRLPLTQQLVLEVLAGRWRTGERVWTLPSKAAPALRALNSLGLVWHKSGVVDHTCLAGLTPAGERLMLSANYIPPNQRPGGPEA